MNAVNWIEFLRFVTSLGKMFFWHKSSTRKTQFHEYIFHSFYFYFGCGMKKRLQECLRMTKKILRHMKSLEKHFL